MLRRVHPDEHRLRELQRETALRRQNAAAFGGVGLPVATDAVDVIGGRHRPEAGLVRKKFKVLRPMDRTLAAELLEDLVRRAVAPELALRDFEALDIAPHRRHWDSFDRRR